MIYIICFLLAILFAYIANRLQKNKRKYYFFSIIAILIPAILAGLRSINVGTDIKIYVLPMVEKVSRYNFFKYVEFFKNDQIELLYSLLTYVVVKISNNINILFLVQHLLICVLFYFGANNFKEKSYPWLTYGLFLIMYYNLSLNIVRQFIALAIIFYAFKYIEQEKPLKYVISILIASLFHSTAIIAISFYVIHWICKVKKRVLYLVLTIIVLIIGLLSFNELLRLMSKLGIIASKYVTRYAITDMSKLDIDWANSIIRLYTLFLIMIQYKKIKNDKNNLFYMIMCIYDFIILQVGAFVPFAFRLSIYFNIISLMNVSRIIKSAEKNKRIILLMTCTIYIMYFTYTYIITGSTDTYPYELYIN